MMPCPYLVTISPPPPWLEQSVLQARHDVDAAADLRYDAIPGVLQRIRELEKRKREPPGKKWFWAKPGREDSFLFFFKGESVVLNRLKRVKRSARMGSYDKGRG